MDYRELLKTYIRLVVNCEGVDFLPRRDSEYQAGLSQEQLEELRKLSAEACGE